MIFPTKLILLPFFYIIVRGTTTQFIVQGKTWESYFNKYALGTVTGRTF